MNSLYDKLKVIQDLAEEARLKTLEEKENADIEKLRKEKEEYLRFVDDLKTKIIEKIESGKIPVIKIKDFNKKSWINSALKKEAKYQIVWDEMISFFKKEKMHVIVKNEHDGMGMEDWLTVTVDLIKSGYRNENSISSRTHGLNADLGVGEYRG